MYTARRFLGPDGEWDISCYHWESPPLRVYWGGYHINKSYMLVEGENHVRDCNSSELAEIWMESMYFQMYGEPEWLK